MRIWNDPPEESGTTRTACVTAVGFSPDYPQRDLALTDLAGGVEGHFGLAEDLSRSRMLGFDD